MHESLGMRLMCWMEGSSMSNVLAVFRLIDVLTCSLRTHADINQAHEKDTTLENLPKNLRRYVNI